MSHVATIKVRIKDLSALRAACAELGASFVDDQKTYKWYGRSVGDTELPEGITVDMLGKCAHAIKLPGVNYEVGVVLMPDGTYTLAWDEFGDGSFGGHDGQKLIKAFGPKLQTLVQLYGCHATTSLMQQRGFTVRRTLSSTGAIELVGKKQSLQTLGGLRR